MIRLTALGLLVFTGLAVAQPRVTGIQNNYSYLIPGTPNYGIAQGSIFVLYGSGLAPTGLLQQGFNPALARNLGGVSVKITIGATTTEAIPYYVSPTQIAAILPSATPVGAGNLTVTYNGQTSAAFALTVVPSAFGILTLGGNGLGNAAVYDLNYNYISPTNAANPGQVVYFWGTGQGPDPNDETRLIASPQNLANLPFEFYIANKPARVIYHGRSTYPGLDQIAVEIPADINGCYASAYAKTGNFISNFVSIPVAASGRVCNDWFTSDDDVQRLLGTGKTEVNLGWFYLVRFLTYTPSIAGQPQRMITQDSATAQFLRSTPFDSSNWGSVGGFSNPGCIVTTWRTQSPFAAPIVKRLDAGPSVTLTLPDGVTTRTLTKEQVSNYAFSVNDATPGAQLIIPATGGTFRFRAPGGDDVGVAEASINANNPLVWNEHTTISNVSRSQPLTVTWRGGAPGGFVLIQGGAVSGANGEIFTSFGCTEKAEAGRFTVPRDVLASMAASTVFPGNVPSGTLIVAHFTLPARFTASGLDHGSIVWETYSATSVNFQ
jgi:uncharacterized protein (TIGR03437 family)